MPRCLLPSCCLAFASVAAGCGGVLSLNSRPRALDAGEVRFAFAQGVTRSTRGDFVRSEPEPYDGKATLWMTELSAHYGLTDRLDIGTRVRPLARGGKLESMHFSFGSDDAVLIADLPDNVAAIRLSTAVGASGLVSIRTTPLLTVEEMDKALDKGANYRAPGSTT